MNLFDLFLHDLNEETRYGEEINNLLLAVMVKAPARRRELFWIHAQEYDLLTAVSRLEDAELVTPAGGKLLRDKIEEIQKAVKVD